MASALPLPDDQLPIGTVIDGRYRIDAVLGTGGMGCVYKGEHTGIGRPVAIKVLHADLNRNREAAARFQREALASGRLDHPNIVNVSDFGVLDGGACYLVMEVLEGESLGARLERETTLGWREALEIIRGVLYGLGHAHERGVVHRDIKPDNIFLTKDLGAPEGVKILDFGIAKLYAGSPDDPASTRAGLTVGTPAYLSPEQAVGGDITPASDIYSTTVVLFEMLTGRAPFEDKDPLAMLGAHVSRKPPTLAECAPGLELPPGLEEMVRRGLVKVAAERISSTMDFLVWIDTVLAANIPTALPRAAGSSPMAHPRLPARAGDWNLTAALEAVTAPGTVPRKAAGSGAAPQVKPPMEPTTVLPVQTRAVSLGELGEPIPRKWIVRGGIAFGMFVIAAIVLAIATRGSKAASEEAVNVPPPPLSQPVQPQAIVRPPAPRPQARAPMPPVAVKPAAPRSKLDVLVAELERSATCVARKAAIPKLVALADPAAIPALRIARNRRGANGNGCMIHEADLAIERLSKLPRRR